MDSSAQKRNKPEACEIFKGDYGISFFRTDTKNRSKVSVRNAQSVQLAVYRFNKIPQTIQSPYISWANLNCCNGWRYDEAYLYTAVQEGKKLCAGITVTNDEQAFCAYRDSLGEDYLYFCRTPTHNGPYTFYHIDVTRRGCISDYIDVDEVKTLYEELGVDFLDFGKISGYAQMPMIQLLDGTADFDYANTQTDEQWAVAGLLLGYPVESSAARLLE